MKLAVYIVQGDPRDHHGEILLITHDKKKAEAFCRTKLKAWNLDSESLIDCFNTLPEVEFLRRYLGDAWISTPQLITRFITI